MKAPSPLLGFNNNVKHKGKVFHIQTEDSGVKHPHVITHLFVDGGRILKSTKTSYAEFLEDEQLATKVRQLMQEQHKAMFIALRAGKFDHLVDGGEVPASSHARPEPRAGQGAAPSADRAARPRDAAAEAPISGVPVSTAPVSTGPVSSSPSSASPSSASPLSASALSAGPMSAAPASAAPVSAGPISVGPLSSVPASAAPVTERTAPAGPPSVRPTPAASMPRPPSLQPPPPRQSQSGTSADRAVASERRVDPRAETVAAMPADSRPRLASPALELNLEALERSSGDVKPSSSTGGDLAHLPPPPAAVLGRRAQTFNTGYRSIQTDARAEPTAPSRPDTGRGSDVSPASGRTPTPPAASGGARPRSVATPMPARPAAVERRSLTPSGARYAPSRPASIFGSARPQEGSSIFGEDLISEKSLDEVILSYLAEDLDGSKPKR